MKTNIHCLRVALVYKDTVFQERVFTRVHEPVITIGEDEANLFSVPAAGLGGSLEVFSREEKGYCFRFTDQVELNLTINEQSFDVEELIEDRRAVEVGRIETGEEMATVYELTLRTGDWGVIGLGQTSIFFQVMESTEVIAGRAALENVDRALALTLLVALLLHLGFLIAAFLQPPTADLSAIHYLDRFVTISVDDVADAEDEPEPEPEVAQAQGAEAAPEEAGEVDAPSEEFDEPEIAEAEAIDDEIEIDVNSIGIHAALSPADMDDSPFARMLADSDALDASMELSVNADGAGDVFSGREGGMSLRSDGAGGGSNRDVYRVGEMPGNEGARAGADVGGTGARGVGETPPPAPTVSGDFCDPSDIRRVVNARANRIRHCFERELQSNPGLSGQITVNWRIQLDGSVGAVRIERSTMQNPRVEACLMQTVERMRFSEPDGGACVINYPFVFSGIE